MWMVIGHDRVVNALRLEVADDRLPHALLLTGPSGIGKTHLALELAKALNCVGEDPPCQVCLHCRQIDARSHPDVTVIERLAGKDSILIQQVREMRGSASLRPFQGRRKVYIIDGAESLTAQAADALLKTLEEPEPQVVIVLTAIDADALPATILSRCRIVPLHSVDLKTLREALAARGEQPDVAEQLARLSRGSVGWALQAARQPKLARQQEELLTKLSTVMDMNLEDRLQLAESLTAEKKDRSPVRRSLELLLLLARDLLLVTQGLPTQLTSGEQGDVLTRQAERYSLADIHGYVQRVRVAMQRIDQNVDPRLALEALFLSMP